jgi:hypothetical protein
VAMFGTAIGQTVKGTLFQDAVGTGDWSIGGTGENIEIREPEQSNKVWATFQDDWGLKLTGAPNLQLNGILYSYGRNLSLQAASGHYIELLPKNSSYGLILREYNSSDYGNIEVTSAGLGLGYNTSGAHLMVKTNGYIGIGTTNPSNKLHVVGSTRLDVGTDRNLSFVSWDLAGPGGITINAHNDANDTHKPLAIAATNILFHASTLNATGDLYVEDNMGIGTTNTQGYKLAVKGGIYCEEVKVVGNVPQADYVFEDDYELKPLKEVEIFIEENNHLPDIPSAKEFSENGYKVGEMDEMLLRKVEELTLYILEQEKRIKALEAEIKENE